MKQHTEEKKQELTLQELTLEEAMQKLEEITEKMEEETLPLADMMALYKEGKKLQEHAKALLDMAEKELLVLEQGEDMHEE